jgi:hypothetical protein
MTQRGLTRRIKGRKRKTGTRHPEERCLGLTRLSQSRACSAGAKPITKKFPKPPFKAQPQSIPGRSDQMEPQSDYGEASYRGSNKLKDKKTVITGADSGIGRAVALAFAREGADVLVSYLDEHDDANETSVSLKRRAENACW